MTYITILDDIILAFLSILTCRFYIRHALASFAVVVATGHKIVIRTASDFNKPRLKVGMDHPGRLRGRRTLGDRPTPYLLHARREVVHQLELFVPAFDNPGQHTVPTALDPRQESVRPRHVPGLVQRGQRIFKFDGKGDHQTAAVRVDPGFNVC